MLFAFIVLRGLSLARRNEDTFCRLAATGLVLMFGLQACINMMVNVHLMPAKGMTLPFISYGGSSLLSLALGMGFLIALTRRRPRAEMLDRFAQDWRADERAARSCSPPAAPAAISSRPRRWPSRCSARGVRVALATDERVDALCRRVPGRGDRSRSRPRRRRAARCRRWPRPRSCSGTGSLQGGCRASAG